MPEKQSTSPGPQATPTIDDAVPRLSDLSFTTIATIAGVATATLLAVGVFMPTYLAGGAVVAGLTGVGVAAGRRLWRRTAAKAATIGPSSLTTLHAIPRVKATIEAYNLHEKPDVPALVDYLLQQATLHQASDVHIVPYKDFTLVRYRVDGILTDVGQMLPRLRDLVTNRLKVLAGAVTFVHDRPQDGRIDLKVSGRDVNLRAAFMPTLHGERIVMRILDRAELAFGLASLGFTPEQLAQFTDILFRPQGMVILNGPAGSGKTTTIYAALRAILEHSQNSASIYTLEDPTEYDLMNINQTQIEEAQGFTFAQGLRTMLRQDPDVIMVGEIRDLDTARISIQAGMTGHLIITTVHSKQAAGVFVRLFEIGVDAHSVASAVTAVVAQRLVRVLCESCKRPAAATPGQEARLGAALQASSYYAPTGCAACNQKGYAGRLGVFEILTVNESTRELIGQRASPDRIHQDAVQRGMTSLIDNGLRLARAGQTSLDEILRILGPDQRGA